MTLIEHPDQSPITLTGKQKKFIGYYKIARHYVWALNHTFYNFNYKHVIVTEGLAPFEVHANVVRLDDLNLAPDFFDYFAATRRLLDEDSSLWCVSAWNDNGKQELIEKNNKLLHRTDFFPGLSYI